MSYDHGPEMIKLLEAAHDEGRIADWDYEFKRELLKQWIKEGKTIELSPAERVGQVALFMFAASLALFLMGTLEWLGVILGVFLIVAGYIGATRIGKQ